MAAEPRPQIGNHSNHLDIRQEVADLRDKAAKLVKEWEQEQKAENWDKLGNSVVAASTVHSVELVVVEGEEPDVVVVVVVVVVGSKTRWDQPEPVTEYVVLVVERQWKVTERYSLQVCH